MDILKCAFKRRNANTNKFNIVIRVDHRLINHFIYIFILKSYYISCSSLHYATDNWCTLCNALFVKCKSRELCIAQISLAILFLDIKHLSVWGRFINMSYMLRKTMFCLSLRDVFGIQKYLWIIIMPDSTKIFIYCGGKSFPPFHRSHENVKHHQSTFPNKKTISIVWTSQQTWITYSSVTTP